MKRNHNTFIRGCSKRVYKKYWTGRIDVDGIGYSLKDYADLVSQFKQVKIGDLIYNPYRNIFEPVKEVKFRWISLKWRSRHYSKRFPNVRVLDVVIITELDYILYDFDYKWCSDHDDFKRAPIPETTLKVWY